MTSSTRARWFRRRAYLHFDLPLSLERAVSLVTSPDAVARHSFYPFLRFTVSTTKTSFDRGAKRLRRTTKDRDISYCSHADANIFAYYSNKLEKLYEAELHHSGISESVLAFRLLGRSNVDFATRAFHDIQDFPGDCGVVALDITKFFDTLDHDVLFARWTALLGGSRLPYDHYAVFKAITRYSYVDKQAVFKAFGISVHNPRANGRSRICDAREFRSRVRDGGLIRQNAERIGIPQGSPISATLSNIYMLEFDQYAYDMVRSLGGNYYRYCDDMLFIVPMQDRDEIAGKVREFLKNNLKIDINTKKTELRYFAELDGEKSSDRPLQYLGFMFDGSKSWIRSASIARYSERVRRGVRLAIRTQEKYNKIRAGKGLPAQPLFLRKLYSRYSYLGRRNFVTYGFRAARVMKADLIRRQLRPCWRKLRALLKSK